MEDLLDILSDLENSQKDVTVALSVRLGNPAEELDVNKSGKIVNLSINEDKPRQTSFYVQYPEAGPGGAIRFKCHPHEVKNILDKSGSVVYST